jgi:glycosyltransferase involved in cell wall biosynthesis
MKVLVVDNAHLYKTPDGKYYTPSIYNYEFFQRYLNIFDEVRFVSKTKHVTSIDESKFLLVSREGLEIYELPWYQGVKGLLRNVFKLFARYRNVFEGCDCYILRVAQIESYLAYILGNKQRKPYAVEVVNDPATFTDVNGVFKTINCYILSIIVGKANGASYVTEYTLQNLYPSTARKNGENENFFESYYSSVELEERDIRAPKQYGNTKKKYEIVHVSNSINGDTKGHSTLLKAIKLVVTKGYDISLTFIGDGSFVPLFKKYANDLGIGDKVNFIGRLHSRGEVLEKLSRSDLLVYPTHMEGLPRCVIEAMSVGLPCISTPIAGIPELLAEKYLFDPSDSKGFAEEIIRLISNPDELEKMSFDNVEVARRYTKDKLKKRRNSFYHKLRKLAEKRTFKN